MTRTKQDAAAEWRGDGWRSVLAAGAGVGATSIHYYALGALIGPLQAEFGWSRAQITGGLLMTSVGMLIGSPLFGMLADRWNVRRMALGGLALYAGALASLSLAGPAIWTWYAGWALLAIVQGVAGFVVWTMVVTSRFDRHRGLALAVTMAGTALTGTLAPPIVQALVATHGWRTALATMAGGGFVIAFLLALLFFHDPRRGRVGRETPSEAAATRPGLSFAEAAATLRFWQMGVIFTLVALSASAIMVHLQPMLTDRGISPARAAACAALVGPGLLSGRLLSGVMLDRMPARYVATLFFLGPAAASALLLAAPGVASAGMAAALLVGLTGGAEVDLIAYIASRYFGLRSYGAIYGSLGGAFALGAGAGPSLAGAIFDVAGSYTPVLGAAMATLLACCALVLSLGGYPSFADDRAAPPEA